MTLKYIDDMIESKIKENEECIKFSFYELKIKENLNEQDINDFLRLACQKLENNGYEIYTEGENYYYEGKMQEVNNNLYFIAIKNHKNQ